MITPPVKPVLLAELRTMPRSRDALFARLDLAGDADVIDGRHEDQEPSRHRDVRGEPGALGAERLLHDLDEDLLPFLEQVFYLRCGSALLAVAAPSATASRCRPGLGASAARRAVPSHVSAACVGLVVLVVALASSRTPRRC